MEKLTAYRKIVVDFMQHQADIRTNREGIETQFIKDEAGGHYQLVNVGFRRGHRIYGCFLHIDLKPDGKVYLQHDGTDIEVAHRLVEAGIPKEDIVLAFHQPKYRAYTGFGV